MIPKTYAEAERMWLDQQIDDEDFILYADQCAPRMSSPVRYRVANHQHERRTLEKVT